MMYTKKVVLITGASSGIGEALAIAFNAKGATVIGTSRTVSSLDQVKAKCPHPNAFKAVQLDLEQPDLFNQLIQDMVKELGGIDILINNGGLSQRSTANETSLDIDRRIMEINYFGNIALTKAVLPHMKQKGSGSIIVISSIAGKFGFYLRSAYSASKHALHGFYESLRLEEEGNGLKVLLVCPGKVATNISFHALKGDGTAHAVMDEQQAKGVSADYCAAQIIKALEKGQEEVLIGGREIKAVTLKRLWPKLFAKIIRKQPKV